MIRILKNGLLLAVFCALSLMVQGMMTGTVAHAAYDLTQTSLRYSSSGSNGDESTFILSYESVPHYGVYANRAPHGEYLVHNDIDGGTNDFSYDYDGETYTIYMGDGMTQKISYDADCNMMYVEDLVDDADSGTYEYDDNSGSYVNYGSGHHILSQVAALITNGYSLGDSFTAYTAANGNREFTVIEYPEEQSSSNLPSKWYKMTNESDSDDWIAFTYNSSNGVYTMYHPDGDGGIEKYSYRRFLSDTKLQVLELGSDSTGFGSPTGIYIKWSDREFHTEDASTQIIKYITDGMLIFKNQCLH